MVLSAMRAFACVAGMVVACAACAPPSPVRAPAMSLRDTRGTTKTFPIAAEPTKLTVVIFYAERCPCFRVHEPRIRELAETYASRGVDVLLVDSEVDATMERALASVRERNLPPMAIDPGGRLADALGAVYATYSVVLDDKGDVRYRGGIDSDKNRLSAAPQTFLRDAIDDLLEGRAPRRAEGKTLGCALQTR